MARSEDALKRRAMKRQRTDTEQRLADRIDMRKQQKEKAVAGKATVNHQSSSTNSLYNSKDSLLFGNNSQGGSSKVNNLLPQRNGGSPPKEFNVEKSAPPAHRLNNGRHENDGSNSQHVRSQSYVNDGKNTTTIEDHRKDLPPAKISSSPPSSETLDDKCDSRKRTNEVMMDSRGQDVVPSSPPPNHKSLSTSSSSHRHDVATSKKLTWAPQGDASRIVRNQELRRLFYQTNGRGMNEDDIQRAKVLIARDERKKNHKKTITTSKLETETKEQDEDKDASQQSGVCVDDTESNKKVPPGEGEEITEKSEKEKGKKSASEARAKRDRNNALRTLYIETGGIGMKDDQIKRAKILIDRAERKIQRRSNDEKMDKSAKSRKTIETISQ
jgi:hypothetical protein